MVSTKAFEARNRLKAWLFAMPEEVRSSDRIFEDIQILIDELAPKEAVAPREAEHRVRRHDPHTSLEAALSQTKESAQILYGLIWQYLSEKPMTDEELVSELTRPEVAVRYSPSGIRSRRAELTDAGWVADTGHSRLTKAHRKAVIWSAVGSLVDSSE